MASGRDVDLFLSGAEVQSINVLVVGGGVTGFGTARFLAGVSKGGARITLTDAGDLPGKEEELRELEDLGVSLELGGHREESFLNSDLIIVSPGVPLYIDEIAGARESGVRVIGEMELAFRFIEAPILAVTGTNGKTTTTALLGEILINSGIKAIVGGNIGDPLVNLVDKSKGADYVVAEVSSFQLEAIESFRPRVGALLNISPDHLDRYPGYEEYIKAKMNLFINQSDTDYAVLNGDDPMVLVKAGGIAGRKIFFSREREIPGGVYLKGEKIVCEAGDRPYTYDPDKYFLTGVHNMENIMAALGSAAVVGAGGAKADEAIAGFRPAPHRLEKFLTFEGVTFYDDSKATNVGAALKSIESFEGNIHLVMGGVDKGGSYAPLAPAVTERVKALYLIGEAKEKIKGELGYLVPTLTAESMEEAVSMIEDRVKPGDVVLLAPACSSFDMYGSYKERGEDFKRIVKKRFLKNVERRN